MSTKRTNDDPGVAEDMSLEMEPEEDEAEIVMPSTSEDGLGHVLSFIDFEDYLSTITVSRQWRHTLNAIDGQLWEGLIRKHHPIMIEIDARFPYVDEDKPLDMDESAEDLPQQEQPTLAVMPKWKRAFQRRLEILDRSEMQPAIPEQDLERNDGTAPKPLSAYCILFELHVFKVMDEENFEKVRTISRLAENAETSGRGFLGFKLDIPTELSVLQSDYTFPDADTEIEASMVMIDKSSGKQAVICHGESHDIQRDEWHMNRFELMKISQRVETAIRSCLMISQCGCIRQCDCGGHAYETPTSFWVTPACDCCSCEENWNCYGDVEVSLFFSISHSDPLREPEFIEDASRQLELIERLQFI
mmetsp:Transcript_26086/g.56512  ORF Transcript_26086/g.56512 Transcript_26086/m.56512 type:complete len:360 (-) Transcript_26086:290-1369(-)